jgi:precorrin-6A/cobalt-precorrin-6A reductase
MKALLLAGTTEGRQVAELAQCCPALDMIASLAGHTADPRPLPCELRVGGFGGVDGLTRFLTDRAIDAVLDATHPFSRDMPRHALAATRATGTPHARLVRPPWLPSPGDRWIDAEDVVHAARSVRDLGVTRVLLTIGRLDLARFAGSDHVEFVIRTVENPGPLPFRPLATIQARGPFTVAGEAQLLAEYGIELVVTKNAGGDAAKLVAARSAKIPVVMVRRPPPVTERSFDNASAALAWLTSLVA